VPARPSTEELKYLEEKIKKLGKDINVLILGSTIEYRSLCKKLNILPYVADFDESIYKVLTSYSKEDFPGEHFMEVDWLDIDDENKYDVILGHRGPNVIGRDMLGRFFHRLHRSLKPGGNFYSKGNVKFENDVDRLEDLVDQWAFESNRKYPLFSYIEVELYFHCADEEGYVDYPKARTLVKSWYDKKRISEEDYDLIKILISLSSESRFRGIVYEEELKNAINSVSFKKTEWLVLDKDICSNMPIIKMTK